jgi:hypothetical protein
MFISKMALPRRAFLRGMGAVVALPFLDAMIPAFAARAGAAGATPKRFGAIYIPHGAIHSEWVPRIVGTGFEFTPILKPLEPFRDSLVVLSNLDGPLEPAGGGGHAISPSSYLSGVRPKVSQGTDVYNGTTLDQVIAAQIGQDTSLPSLELGIEDASRFVGACEAFYSCAYVNNIAWRTPTMPLPTEINPRVVFERLFGAPGTAAERRARIEEDRSILDSVAAGTESLQRRLGSRDRARLSDYLDNIREIERRIQRAEQHGDKELTVPDAPPGIPDSFEEHAMLLFDLVAVAYQADVTRVFTFMLARDFSGQTFPQSGVADAFHALSHHQNKPEKMVRFAQINRYHYQLLAQFLDKLRSTPDGDGSLLDHSVVLYGSGMGDANVHGHAQLPLVVAGGGLAGGRHLTHPSETPLGNLLVSLAGAFGIERERFGDSTGRVNL